MAQADGRWNATDYANNATAQYTWAQSLIGQLDLTGNESVLDIGCGDGRITAEIANVVTGSVLGIDSSVNMVSLATSRYGKMSDRLQFRHMDASNIAVHNKVDLVFSNAALHWVSDHRAVLAGINSALKPGGRVVLSMGGKGNAPDLLPMIEKLIQQPVWRAYFDDFVFPYAFYGSEDYTQWLPAAGLQTIRVELVPKDMVHENVEALKGWLRTTWFPYTDRVPAGQKARFVEELIDMYLAQYPVDDDGRTHVRMIRLEVEALKV